MNGSNAPLKNSISGSRKHTLNSKPETGRVEDESEVLWVEGVTTSDDKLAIHILLAGEVCPNPTFKNEYVSPEIPGTLVN